MVHFVAFYALFMTSEGLMVTQHEPIKTTEKVPIQKYILYLHSSNKFVRFLNSLVSD